MQLIFVGATRVNGGGGGGGVGAGASVFRCIHRRESEGRSERKVGVPLGVICL